MKVLKFGGTSVATAENISKVIEILIADAKNTKLAVVVSALGGTTDTLIEASELASAKNIAYLEMFEKMKDRHLEVTTALVTGIRKEQALQNVETTFESLKQLLQGMYLLNEFSNKTKDKIVSFGELLSSFIISEALSCQMNDVAFKDSRELIRTNSDFTQATIQQKITYSNITEHFKASPAQVTILPGFVSSNEAGETTTLGRGGSDYTAAIVAAALKVPLLEIWTDVSGMFTAHPKLVKQAFPIAEISYHEAMELSHFGAKVLYPPAIQPVLDQGIPIKIKNTFHPAHPGTLITQKAGQGSEPVKGISHVENVALLTLEGAGMVGIPGFSKRLFATLSIEKINVVMITQASSEHSICVGVHSDDAAKAKNCIDIEFAYEISLKTINPLGIEKEMAIIAVVGENMKNHQGISGSMFSALGKNNVNVRAIAQGASERNISAVIAHKDIKKALNTLHYRFFEKQIKTLNLYIVGVGNVGRRLLDQIAQQQSYLLETLLLNIKVTGISSSKKMLFNEEGINLSNWQEDLTKGIEQNPTTFYQTVKEHNLRNSIFVDITANEAVAKSYAHYLRDSIAVVACNKIACSSIFKDYKELKGLSRKYNAPFLFETNVGAGLPVINTLNNLINSGDKITSIQAVLSGSLNFVFNNFNATESFHDVVKQAQIEGYTEPDPSIDLSGVDVMRKILILARESGYKIDMKDIENDSFLPAESLKATSVDDFYKSLKQNNAHFETLYHRAQKNNGQLKYVAEFNNGKAKVGLKEVGKDHPFYNLEGKDNIVLFYTSRYAEQPLIIKGAGAGADVTASGLFADIITLGRN